MKKLWTIVTALLLSGSLAYAAQSRTEVVDRADAAAKVLKEIMAASDKGIPQEVMASAKCVAVVPSMMKGGFIFGANYGRGVATCQAAKGWSAPAPFVIEGGSWGLQIGGQAVDLVMLVVNQHGMDQLLNSKFKIGADVSGAAGPVGREASASTDWKMRAEVLTYSRARGLFAGVTLNGAAVKQDDDSTNALYGKLLPFDRILRGGVPAPAGTQGFIREVAMYEREAKAAQGESAAAKPSTSSAATASSPSQQTGTSGAIGGSTNPQSSAAGTATEQKDTSSAAASSSDVQSDIQKALNQSSGLPSSNIEVDVSDTTVILSGNVPTSSDKATAARIAREHAGNRQVDDSNLTVK